MSTQGRSVITIGNFDGVHLGHRALLAAARALAAEHQARSGQTTSVVALAFDPHPATLLRPGSQPARLTTMARRTSLLREAGADRVVPLEPTPALLGMTPEQFVARLVTEHAPIAIVEGADFRFGKARAGDVALLRALGRSQAAPAQFAVHVVDPVQVALGDHSAITASSTMARWLIERARVSDAARVLGKPYTIEGQVVQGDRRGRTLGYPTANVTPESMLPADGVYAGIAVAQRPDGSPAGSFAAAVSVGTKPQFNTSAAARTLEAHLLDVPRERQGDVLLPPIAGLPEYGWRIAIDLIAYLRDQSRFDGVPALVAQIDRDCLRVREAISRRGTLPEPSPITPTSLTTASAAPGPLDRKEAPACR